MKRKKVYRTFLKESCNPGDNVIHAAIVPNSSKSAYIIRVEVEFRHDGQALQHNEQAVLPQQHAS